MNIRWNDYETLMIGFEFSRHDIWVGCYWDDRTRTMYVCPFPMVVFSFRKQWWFGPKE